MSSPTTFFRVTETPVDFVAEEKDNHSSSCIARSSCLVSAIAFWSIKALRVGDSCLHDIATSCQIVLSLLCIQALINCYRLCWADNAKIRRLTENIWVPTIVMWARGHSFLDYLYMSHYRKKQYWLWTHKLYSNFAYL